MFPQSKLEDSQLSPSFNCYSTDTTTSRSIAKAIREEKESQFHQFENEQEFEFSLLLTEENVTSNVTESQNWTVFPVFNRNLLITSNDNETDKSDANDIKEENDVSGALARLFIDDPEESSSSYSSSEVDELENLAAGTYCVWRPKVECMAKCKKSSSTGSGSKRWRFRYLLRRSNSEGKEPMEILDVKKAEQKRSSGEAGRWKARTPVHEQFYVRRRAENEVGKRKSYLPYRKDLVGLFGNVNGMGKMLPF